MPELPEVETVVNGLKPQIIGQNIIAIHHSDKSLRYPLPDFETLIGATVINIVRRAKYLLFHFEHGKTLIWHLGMTGQFHVLALDAPSTKHEHVLLTLNNGLSLRYRDTRRFGYAGVCDTAHLNTHMWIRELGIEPLCDDFDGAYLQAKLCNKTLSIKQAIMDNHNVVGVGNIYASESLFRAKIHPTNAANSLHPHAYNTLTLIIKEVLNEAIIAGGSTISDFVKADGKPGYFAHSFRVYGREGKPCLVCKHPIARIVQSGRASFFCPNCQGK